MKKLFMINSLVFATQETHMPPAAAGKKDTMPGGNEPAHAGAAEALYKNRVSDASIANVGETTARQRFDSVFQWNDRDRDGGVSNRINFKDVRLDREAATPRATFTKDVSKDFGNGKTKAKAPTADKSE
eukprot:jgi/Tetstr1/464877/TSEL_009614.t1